MRTMFFQVAPFSVLTSEINECGDVDLERLLFQSGEVANDPVCGASV